MPANHKVFKKGVLRVSDSCITVRFFIGLPLHIEMHGRRHAAFISPSVHYPSIFHETHRQILVQPYLGKTDGKDTPQNLFFGVSRHNVNSVAHLAFFLVFVKLLHLPCIPFHIKAYTHWTFRDVIEFSPCPCPIYSLVLRFPTINQKRSKYSFRLSCIKVSNPHISRYCLSEHVEEHFGDLRTIREMRVLSKGNCYLVYMLYILKV